MARRPRGRGQPARRLAAAPIEEVLGEDD